VFPEELGAGMDGMDGSATLVASSVKEKALAWTILIDLERISKHLVKYYAIALPVKGIYAVKYPPPHI
jgi:hypothetical protein